MAYVAPVAGASASATVVDENFRVAIFGVAAFATDAGGTDSYSATLTPSPVSYTNIVVALKVNTANTGPATCNLNSIGAANIKKYEGGMLRNLETGDILAGQVVWLAYDGTQFIMLNPSTTVNTPQGYIIDLCFSVNNQASLIASCGFSDASTDNIGVGMMNTSGSDSIEAAKFSISPDTGALYVDAKTVNSVSLSSSPGSSHMIYLGTDFWSNESVVPEMRKNGSTTTFTGTARYGPLGHDNTNNYMLVLYSTTKIARFTGIAGTNLTNINSDITLDTAVSQVGFVFDDLNDQYVCVDLTNNLLRKFDSAGTTVETVSYTVDDSKCVGIALIKNVYYLVLAAAYTQAANTNFSQLTVSFVPTNMRRG